MIQGCHFQGHLSPTLGPCNCPSLEILDRLDQIFSSLESYNVWKVLSHIKLESAFLWCLPYFSPSADLGNIMGWVSALASGSLVTIKDSSFSLFSLTCSFKISPSHSSRPFSLVILCLHMCSNYQGLSNMTISIPASRCCLIPYSPKCIPRNTCPCAMSPIPPPKGALGKWSWEKQTLSLEILKTKEHVRGLSSRGENLISGV